MSYQLRIAEARKRRGTTQAELADAAGVARATINRVERGSASLTVEQLIKVAGVLGTSISWLFEDEDTNTLDGCEKLWKGWLERTFEKTRNIGLCQYGGREDVLRFWMRVGPKESLREFSFHRNDEPSMVSEIVEILSNPNVTPKIPAHWEQSLLDPDNTSYLFTKLAHAAPPSRPPVNTEMPSDTPQRYRKGKNKPEGIAWAKELTPVQAALARVKAAQTELAEATAQLEEALGQ